MQQPVFYLGPFQGITDVHYRRLFAAYFGGVVKMFTPFFTGIDTDHSKSLNKPELDPKRNKSSDTVPQLLSRDADELIRFANQCHEMGYHEVNWNLGCPFPRVAAKKRGSGLLPFTEDIDQILNLYYSRCSVKLSIKCRLGLSSDTEFDRLIPVFNRYPLSELIVHARTGIQMYKGKVNLEKMKASVHLIRHPLIYNGDIFDRESFELCRTELPGISLFMLGRGILSDPFLATDLIGINSDCVRSEKLKEFLIELLHSRLSSGSNEATGLGKMKELWSYLRWSFDEPVVVWRLIRKVKNTGEYHEAVSRVFDETGFVGQGYARSKEEKVF